MFDMRNRKIGVCHIIHSLQIGGAENVVYMYAKFHDKSRYRLEVCTFRPDGRILERIKSLNIKVYCLGSSSSNPLSLFRLTRILRKGSFQIVHFHNPLPIFWGIPSAIAARVPVRILTEHSINYPGRLGSSSFLYNTLRKAMHLVLAVSEEVKNSHRAKTNTQRLVLVYNGIDIDRFYPVEPHPDLRLHLSPSDGDFVVGNVGNLTPQKGQSYLLEALKYLLSEDIRVSLLVVGDGALRPSLESKADKLGIREQVHFLGQRDDVPELLRAVDVVVGSSLREGFPVSLLEAMATGKPVVATDVGGNKEALQDGFTGFLVPPADPKALAFALKKLLSDRDLRIRMGSNARKIVEERFSVHHMVKRTEEIYESLLIKNQ